MKVMIRLNTISLAAIATLIIMIAPAIVTAESAPLKIGTGGPTGNYFAMGKDIVSYCQEAVLDADLEALNSDGSTDNLLGMTQKKYSAGIVQEDVLQYHAKKDPRSVNRNRMKIIAGLHLETAHLLIPKNYKPKKGKKGMLSDLWSKFKPEEKKPISLDLLKNQTVASWGGSIVSAKALSYFMELNLNVVDVPKDKRNNINLPIFLVGGQPYKPVEKFLATNKYVLVAIDYSKIQVKAPFYQKMSANYKVGAKIASVPSFAVRALLLGKSFRKESRNTNMQLLGQCIVENLADLADDPNTNPNWGTVYELEEDGAQTNWNYFKLK